MTRICNCKSICQSSWIAAKITENSAIEKKSCCLLHCICSRFLSPALNMRYNQLCVHSSLNYPVNETQTHRKAVFPSFGRNLIRLKLYSVPSGAQEERINWNQWFKCLSFAMATIVIEVVADVSVTWHSGRILCVLPNIGLQCAFIVSCWCKSVNWILFCV